MVGISKSFYMCGAVDLVVLSLFVMYQLRLSLISRPIKAELAGKKRNRLGFFQIKDVNAEKADVILKQKEKEKEIQKQKEKENAKAKKIAKEKEIAKKAKESLLEAKKVKDRQKKDADNAAAMKAKKEADSAAAAAALKAKTVSSSSKPKSAKKK